MKIKFVVMRASHMLLAMSVLLFLAFLASPGFVDSVDGHGTVTMLPGYGAVLWWAVVLPSAAVHYPRDAVVLFLSWWQTHLHLHLFPRYIGDQFENQPINPRIVTQPVYAPGEFTEFSERLRSAIAGVQQ